MATKCCGSPAYTDWTDDGYVTLRCKGCDRALAEPRQMLAVEREPVPTFVEVGGDDERRGAHGK